ncbi:hypothetical protein [Inconstantimicrobium mannanitabidum]|uniref:Uncharacterized protein n=1 Tax=Inconstantimicrobium mannanitabidum TaxID=1604901 RepID=A0ACB5R789_9CLOT|nr:hypothetical protein [Clostridium sp. TW13]GKX64873.1 hypothetical protein rsdtw13_01310 [Clostridium sp. TW13]
MKYKCLSKLMAGLVAATCLVAPIQASASTITAPQTQSIVASATVTDQTVKLDSVSYVATDYIHSDANYWHTTCAVNHYKAYIVVDNKSYDKTIVLHYIDGYGEWKDSNKATYVETRSDGKELWVVDGYFLGNAQFAINYKEANVWDNNNGKDYMLYDLKSTSPEAAQPVKVQSLSYRAVASIHDNNNYWHAPYTEYIYTTYIVVDNKSYDKTIVLHYIDADGVWKDSPKATYVSTQSDGKELWVINGTFGGNAEFAVNYKEANLWDNNYGKNYRLLDF